MTIAPQFKARVTSTKETCRPRVSAMHLPEAHDGQSGQRTNIKTSHDQIGREEKGQGKERVRVRDSESQRQIKNNATRMLCQWRIGRIDSIMTRRMSLPHCLSSCSDAMIACDSLKLSRRASRGRTCIMIGGTKSRCLTPFTNSSNEHNSAPCCRSRECNMLAVGHRL